MFGVYRIIRYSHNQALSSIFWNRQSSLELGAPFVLKGAKNYNTQLFHREREYESHLKSFKYS